MLKDSKFILALALLFLFHSVAQANQRVQIYKKTLSKIAFGSCNRHWKDQKYWNKIASNHPDLWLWLGDNIYGEARSAKELSKKYQQFLSSVDYQNFKSKIPINGVWDDHDYGTNGSSAEHTFKLESQRLFLDFMSVPLSSSRRQETGIYHAEIWGDAYQSLKIIYLDTRYFKTRDEILGNEQFVWLENIFKNYPTKITFILSSIPFWAPRVPLSEEWADYPKDKERLLLLVSKYNVPGVLILSGDKHFGHFFESDSPQILEFMSSGLTHVVRKPLQPVVQIIYPESKIFRNWGEVIINWSENPKLQMSLHNLSDGSKIVRNYQLNDGIWLLKFLSF